MHPWEKQERTTFLEFIPRPTPSSSYRFITYSYSVARGKVALSAYKRFSLSFSVSAFPKTTMYVYVVYRCDSIIVRFPYEKKSGYFIEQNFQRSFEYIYIYFFSLFSRS